MRFTLNNPAAGEERPKSGKSCTFQWGKSVRHKLGKSVRLQSGNSVRLQLGESDRLKPVSLIKCNLVRL